LLNPIDLCNLALTASRRCPIHLSRKSSP